MVVKPDRWIVVGAAALLLLALLACKKEEKATSEPTEEATEAPAEEAKAEEAPHAAEAEAAEPTEDAGAMPADTDAGEVEIKRYGANEKLETGKAKVTAQLLMVYPEADATKEKVTELKRDTTVELKASYEDFYLIEYTDEGNEEKLGWVSKEQSVARVVARATSPQPQPQPQPTSTAPQRARRRDIGDGRSR